jgi:hypothetical protein
MSIVTEMKQIAYYYRKETDCSDAVVAHLGGSCDHWMVFPEMNMLNFP